MTRWREPALHRKNQSRKPSGLRLFLCVPGMGALLLMESTNVCYVVLTRRHPGKARQAAETSLS